MADGEAWKRPLSEINVARIGRGAYVVELVGDHGFHNADEVGATLRTALVGDSVLLDLSSASLIDSSIIREVVLAARRATLGGHRLRVQVQPGGHVERTFQLMGVDELVALYRSRADALAAEH